MRRFFCALLALLLIGTAVLAAEEAPVGDYIRLHVVASDDSPAAQALKLKVRDACLARARALLEDCGDPDMAWAVVGGNLPLLEAAARREAQSLGWHGAVRAEAAVCAFPNRVYGGSAVPAGRYRALRVVLGEGKGHNWWCVLYPSLCLPKDVEPGRPVRFYSSILRWLRGWLGGEA
ncbi:MAG: stage II sporulation protein R [Clostridia bacterium]|nr:stage II sporulation protein R [Clostridia bacterium]